MTRRGAAHSVRSKLLLGVLATTGAALLITAAAVAYYDLRSFRNNLVSDITAIADILGLAATPALEFDGNVWTAWPDPVSRGRALP